ncbi:hypothetical protein CHS0354_009516 [Potamilus streckersoni]|uniref:Uncharacterized protein n=1 Tax=Potamilus streckersoni TaxID=2493646 RepID=A0AAE0W092_9BIVA|nr:hypothetical protein CHS0354_009516 [Potamilus streckersoni]
MASQNLPEQTKEEMVTLLENIIKSSTSLQKDIEDILKEVKEIKLLFHSAQSQTSISKDTHDGITDVDVKDNENSTKVRENQDSITGSQSKSLSLNNVRSKMEDQDQKIHKVSEGITEETTAQAICNSEATNVTDEKENTSDKENNLRNIFSLSWLYTNTRNEEEKSIDKQSHPEGSVSGKTHQIQDINMVVMEKIDDQIRIHRVVCIALFTKNGIECSKDSLPVKLEEFKNSFESCLKQLQNQKVQLEETFNAFKEENKHLMEHVQGFSKLSKPDHSDVTTTKTIGESKSSRFDYWWKLWKRQKVESQLYCPNSSCLVRSVTDELLAMLTTQMNTHELKLKMKICKSVEEIKKDVPLILICLQSSRLGTDVSNATKGIQIGPNVAVLILHHADIHALPTQSSREILTAPEYKSLNTIVDMGFLSEKGIYDCTMNDKARKDLTSFLQQ